MYLRALSCGVMLPSQSGDSGGTHTQSHSGLRLTLSCLLAEEELRLYFLTFKGKKLDLSLFQSVTAIRWKVLTCTVNGLSLLTSYWKGNVPYLTNAHRGEEVKKKTENK